MYGVPKTLFTFKLLPILKGTDVAPIDFTSLGFSTSTTVVPGKYTSNPLTYALPGESLTHIKSSDGVLP